MAAISRYIAIGDSFTEGIGDPYPGVSNNLRGWADLVASHLGRLTPGFRYANLAVRGRTMGDVINDQIEPALALRPDLITVYAGMNDLLKMRTDLDAMMARYAAALRTLKKSGARVVTFTAADLGRVPVFRRLRGRCAIYNELLRIIVDELGIELIDFWRFPEYRDPQMWASDRVHLSPLGHQQMAARVLDALGEPHPIPMITDAMPSGAAPVSRLRADVQWAAAFAAPWVVRRVRRLTPGEGVEPKLASLTAVDDYMFGCFGPRVLSTG
jgi:lysophospholipase L1-like esterase